MQSKDVAFDRPGGFRVNDKEMEKEIVSITYVVGWSTKQANTHVRRTTNYFEKREDAEKKYIRVSNRDRVIYCYMNKRTEYNDGSVHLERIYWV